jgi:hypothetical protein
MTDFFNTHACLRQLNCKGLVSIVPAVVCIRVRPVMVATVQTEAAGGEKLRNYGVIRKFTLLLRLPMAVVTTTGPVVAPVGTVVLVSVAETTVNCAAVPLKLTAVEPVRLLPRITTAAPALPDVGSISTNELSPRDSLKTVP